ncbi:tetratricopeptide repeat protein, partial [Bacteroidota bacterium]
MKKISLLLALLIVNCSLIIVQAQNPEIDSLENLLQKHERNDTTRVNLLNETAYKLYSINIDKTLRYAKEAGELADKIGFVKGKAESLRIIGIYYRMKADYPKSLEYYQKSLKISEELGDKKGISKCYQSIGIIYKEQGDYLKALEYYQKS